jgi:Contractile injection system tube protein/LysM domain
MAVTGTQLEKARLELREPTKSGKKSFKPGGSIKTLTFMFNPKDISTSLKAGWNFNAKKSEEEPPEFTGTSLRTLDLEVFLDATDKADGDISPAIETLFHCLRPTAKSKSSGAPFPPIVIFSWGAMEPFVGVVSSVNATLTLFRPSGKPVRANCKVSMQEYPPAMARQNPTSGGERTRRSHQVVLGDSLASIANTEYGSPTMWRAIAVANEVDDPFSLPVGLQLLIPPPAEAAALA